MGRIDKSMQRRAQPMQRRMLRFQRRRFRRRLRRLLWRTRVVVSVSTRLPMHSDRLLQYDWKEEVMRIC